jgi:hypothetical protein
MNGRSAAPPLGKPYTVGLIHSTSAQAALRLLGSTADTGDVRAEGNAVISYLNAHGGLGGRRLVASWYDANAQDDPSTIAERACASWTQDDHVDAAVPDLPIVDMSVMRACLRRTSTPAVSADYHVQTRRSGYAQNPHWLEPMQLSMESYAKTYVDSLAAQGFFKGGRLGIIHDDGNDWTAVERTVLEAELRRHGVPVAARASYRLRGFSQVPSAQPAIDSAVLQFKSRQVDRVISFEPWVGWGFFMLAAERQGYYPTYGLSSQTAWAASYGTGLVPDDQLENAYYVGWSPVLDGVQTSAPWPRLLLCRRIYQASGIRMSGPLAETVAMAVCNGLLDVAALGDAVDGDLTAATFGQATRRVAWQSALLPRLALSTTRPYGVTSVRPARWSTTCRCFRYTGGPTPAAR